MSASALDLRSLDRDVERAWGAWHEWRAALAADPHQAAELDPFEPFRHVSGRAAYEALSKLSVGSAEASLREGLVRWIYALTQERIARPFDVALAVALLEPSAHAALDVSRSASWLGAWRELVHAPDRASALAWLSAAEQRGPAIAAITRERAACRVEIARRMGLGHPAEMVTEVPRDALVAAAHALLDATDDLSKHLLREANTRAGRSGATPSPVDAVDDALARDATEGWPAHLNARWLFDLLGQFVRGRDLKVDLPAPIGAASYARALERFGRGACEGRPSRAVPFSLARDPWSVDAAGIGLLFGALPASVPFHRRALKLSARVAASQARSVARTALFEARTIAVRFLLCDDAKVVAPDLFEELTARLFGVSLAGTLCGAWPVARGNETERLFALLTARPLARSLVERFDEDWFANPRAAQHLIGLAGGLARSPVPSKVDARAAVRDVSVGFEEALG
jgi:hypothetical protein